MTVTGVDKDASKIEALERGEIPIYEPGLEEIVEKNVRAGRLKFTTDLAPAIREARAVFIAVGTPPLPDGKADLSFVRQVAESIGENLNGYKVIVTKSTVPVGTGQMVERAVREHSGGGQEFAWSRIPSSCARARRSRTSCVPTGWSSARALSARSTSCSTSTPRSRPPGCRSWSPTSSRPR